MADIKTLDQRIREDAHEKLRNQIEAALFPVKQLVSWNAGPLSKLQNEAGLAVHMPYVLDRIADHLFAVNVESAERRAIGDFMARVESLQEQVNELRSLSHEHE